jgi:hypothetical protein
MLLRLCRARHRRHQVTIVTGVSVRSELYQNSITALPAGAFWGLSSTTYSYYYYSSLTYLCVADSVTLRVPLSQRDADLTVL